MYRKWAFFIGFVLSGVSFQAIAHLGEDFQEWQWDATKSRYVVKLKNESQKPVRLYYSKQVLPPGSIRLQLESPEPTQKFDADTFLEVIVNTLEAAQMTFQQFLYVPDLRGARPSPYYLPADPLLAQIPFQVSAPGGLVLKMNQTGRYAFLERVTVLLKPKEGWKDSLKKWFARNDSTKDLPVDQLNAHIQKIEAFFSESRPSFSLSIPDILPHLASVDLMRSEYTFTKDQLCLMKREVSHSGQPSALIKEFYYIPKAVRQRQILAIGKIALPQGLKKRCIKHLGSNRNFGFVNFGFSTKNPDPREDFIMSRFSPTAEFLETLEQGLLKHASGFDPNRSFRGNPPTDADQLSVVSGCSSSWTMLDDAASASSRRTSYVTASSQSGSGQGGRLSSLPAYPASVNPATPHQTSDHWQPEWGGLYYLHGNQSPIEAALFLYSDGVGNLYLTETSRFLATPFERQSEEAKTIEQLQSKLSSLQDSEVEERLKGIVEAALENLHTAPQNPGQDAGREPQAEKKDTSTAQPESVTPEGEKKSDSIDIATNLHDGAATTQDRDAKDLPSSDDSEAADDGCQFYHTTYLEDFPLGFFSKDTRFSQRLSDGEIQHHFSLPIGAYYGVFYNQGPEQELRLVPLGRAYEYENRGDNKFNNSHTYYPVHALGAQKKFICAEHETADYRRVFLKTGALFDLLKNYDAKFHNVFSRYERLWPYLTATPSMQRDDPIRLEERFFENNPGFTVVLDGLTALKKASVEKWLTDCGTLFSEKRRVPEQRKGEEIFIDMPALLKLYATRPNSSASQVLDAVCGADVWEFHEGTVESEAANLRILNSTQRAAIEFIPLLKAHDLTLNIRTKLDSVAQMLENFIRLGRLGWYSQFTFNVAIESDKNLEEIATKNGEELLKSLFSPNFFDQTVPRLKGLNQTYKFFIQSTLPEDTQKSLNAAVLSHTASLEFRS